MIEPIREAIGVESPPHGGCFKVTGEAEFPTNIPTSFRANVIWLYVLLGLNFATPVLLLPYLVRVLGAERYGVVVLSQALAQYFAIGTDYGFNFSATRSIAVYRDDLSKVTRLFWTVLSVKGALTATGAVVLCAIVAFVPRLQSDAAIYIAGYVYVVGNAMFPQWLFQGMESMRTVSLIGGLAKLGAMLAVFLLVRGPGDTLVATLLLSCGQLAAGTTGLLLACRRYRLVFIRPTLADILAALNAGWHLFVTSASIALYSNADTLLVGLIAGNSEAAYFSLVDKLGRATTGLGYPVIQAAYPLAVRQMSESVENGFRFLRRTIASLVAGGVLAGVAFLAFARPLAFLSFGSELPAAALIRCLSPFPVLAIMGGALGILVLIPIGCDREQSRLLVAAGVLNVVIACLLINRWGAMGAVISMVVIETIIVIGNLEILRRRSIRFWRVEP